MFTKKSGFWGLQSLGEMLRRWKERIHENRIVNQAVENLIASSRLRPVFFVMAITSGMMATIGILLNDLVILIAAMVLAPLLTPLLSFAAGITLGHLKLIVYALKSFFGGTLTIILFVTAFIKILIYWGYDIDIEYFLDKFEGENTVTLLIISSFLSGFAAIYSWLRSTNNANLVGVAIAVSLIPFISFIGILLALGKITTLLYFLGWIGFNLFSLICGAVSAFIILGFNQPKNKINKELQSETVKE